MVFGKLSIKDGAKLSKEEFLKRLKRSGYSGSKLAAWDKFSKTLPKSTAKTAVKSKVKSEDKK